MKAAVWIKGTLLLAIAFAAGIAVGVTYERRQGAARAPVATDVHSTVRHLSSELDLDQNQQRAIVDILNRHQPEVDAAWHAMQPHMRAMLNSTSDEIIAVLRPDQADKYRKMIATHSSHH